jgi:hypothetical protein
MSTPIQTALTAEVYLAAQLSLEEQTIKKKTQLCRTGTRKPTVSIGGQNLELM